MIHGCGVENHDDPGPLLPTFFNCAPFLHEFKETIRNNYHGLIHVSYIDIELFSTSSQSYMIHRSIIQIHCVLIVYFWYILREVENDDYSSPCNSMNIHAASMCYILI